jgi:hypothetical protein
VFFIWHDLRIPKSYAAAVCLVLVGIGAYLYVNRESTDSDNTTVGSEHADLADETLAFEPLFAIDPASEICQPSIYLGSTASEKVHLLCEFTPDVAPDVTLTLHVNYPLADAGNVDVINDQVRAKIAEVLHGYLDNGVLWPSLSRHWGAWIEIVGSGRGPLRGEYVVEFAVDAYHPAAANPVQTFYYLRFDADTGSLDCQDRYGYRHGSYGSEPDTYRYMEFDLTEVTWTLGCPSIRFEQDESDFNIGEWVRS